MDTNQKVETPMIALVIGAPNGLRGVDNDLAAMKGALTARGFECRICSGEGATRAAILAALESLADDAKGCAEVVIYYSGHGGRVPNPAFTAVRRGQEQAVRFFPMLLPTDVRSGGPEKFLGILVAELEPFFQRIVDAGARLTVIFDCCHASAVVRGDASIAGGEPSRSAKANREVTSSQDREVAAGIRTLSLETSYLQGLPRHFDSLRAEGLEPMTTLAQSNPAIVRLVASDEAQAAFERPADAVILRRGVEDPVTEGAYHGVMTAALVRALAEVGSAPVPWHVVGRRVRSLAAAQSGQRVILKGPYRRILFSGQEDGLRRVAGVTVEGGALALEVGAMCGVEVGDRFFVWPINDARVRERREPTVSAISEVVVARVDASRAWVSPLGESVITVGDSRLAHATVSHSGYGRARERVRLRASTQRGRALLPYVVPEAVGLAEAADDAVDVAVMAEVIENDGFLEIRRPGGGLLRERADFEPELEPRIADVATCFVREALEDLAVAHALVHLKSADGAALLQRVTWSIERQSSRGRETFDARAIVDPLEVEIGDSVTVDVQIVDRGAESLFIWLLLVGPGGRVSLLSRASPTGAELTITTPYTLGLRPGGRREGERIEWPMSVPRPTHGGDGAAWIVLVVADAPATLTMWETDPVGGWQVGRDLLERAGATRARSEPMPVGRAQRWGVERVRLEIGG